MIAKKRRFFTVIFQAFFKLPYKYRQIADNEFKHLHLNYQQSKIFAAERFKIKQPLQNG